MKSKKEVNYWKICPLLLQSDISLTQTEFFEGFVEQKRVDSTWNASSYEIKN